MKRQHIFKFSAHPRLKEAPNCGCGKPQNRTNPQFAPYKDCNGEFGYCHKCNKTIKPEDTEEVEYVPPPVAKQQFLPEPQGFHSRLVDTVMGEEKNGIRKVTWYYRNIDGKIATAKEMYYDKNFKRVKEKHPLFIVKRDSGYYPCLFNEHALTKYPNAIVLLVESEKTAAATATKIDPEQFIFIGTGGANGLTDDKISVLKD
ncbi:MAG TPA: DUF6371 domain-containing protein, partial [Candidatus Kapabacteria bacterium]|nr:DUF6371 domain-containing protein [Candidatus Kapabacteria bacterium]